jgi:hypothetical protein
MDYYNFKKQYVETSSFQTLTGDFTGYVSVLSGVPYIYNTAIVLSALPTFNGDLVTSTYFKDRDINEAIELPFKESSVLFQHNDYLKADLLNEKFNKIRENNIYLYSRMFMANNDLPVSSNLFYYGISSTNDTYFSRYINYSPTIPFFNSANFGYLSGVKDYTAVLNDVVLNNFSIFAITDNSFISLTGNNNELNIVERSSFVESTENSLPFGNLSNICRYKNNIFISDYDSNIIYKYDIAGYYNNDSAIKNKRNYLEALGGKGTKRDKSRFNGPRQIATNGKYLAVYDSNNYIIKVYDINFNYIDKITSVPFIKNPVAAMEFSPFFNLLYVVTYNNSGLKLYLIDAKCLTLVETVDYNITLNKGETVKNIEFSKNDSNYYYICTTNEIYKFFVSKPTTLIGRYSENKLFNNIRATRTTLSALNEVTDVDATSNLWNNQGAITFYNANWEWRASPVTYKTITEGSVVSFLQTSMQNDKFTAGIRLLETPENYDKGLLFTGARLYVYDEPNLYKRSLKTNNLENFGIMDMGILGTNYIHTTTINKELYKLLRDIFAIKNNIVGRFSGVYDYTGILKLTDYNYNIDFSQFILLEQENYFINDNEKNIIGVINRPLSNIFKLQTQLLELTKIDSENIKPTINVKSSPYTNVFVL